LCADDNARYELVGALVGGGPLAASQDARGIRRRILQEQPSAGQVHRAEADHQDHDDRRNHGGELRGDRSVVAALVSPKT
jgi:hypothetical protein